MPNLKINYDHDWCKIITFWHVSTCLDHSPLLVMFTPAYHPNYCKLHPLKSHLFDIIGANSLVYFIQDFWYNITYCFPHSSNFTQKCNYSSVDRVCTFWFYPNIDNITSTTKLCYRILILLIFSTSNTLKCYRMFSLIWYNAINIIVIQLEVQVVFLGWQKLSLRRSPVSSCSPFPDDKHLISIQCFGCTVLKFINL